VQTPVPAVTAPTTTAAPTPTRTSRPAGTTPDGYWWGVDSTVAISEQALANVRAWYRGATPQFWGRYLTGEYAIGPGELDVARAHGIYVYLLVPDRNCSQCAGGGDICGNDRSADQARADAAAALAAAAAAKLPSGVVLFKDIEQVSSCRNEPTPDYLLTWHRTLAQSDYRTGFYGNSDEQSYDFPRAYCAAVGADPDFAHEVVIDGNEPEPQLGAARGTIGPAEAPRFAPYVPDCAPGGSTVIWQYGESVTPANETDVDQLIPGTAGLIAPDGTVT
jgi:hypothetical protein